MSVITPTIYTALSAKTPCIYMKNLKPTEEKNVIIPWLCLGGYCGHIWSIWMRNAVGRNATVWSQLYFLLLLFPAVVATKYLADYLVFLKGWKYLLIKKQQQQKSCTEAQFWKEL